MHIPGRHSMELSSSHCTRHRRHEQLQAGCKSTRGCRRSMSVCTPFYIESGSVTELHLSVLEKLPACNPIQSGPGPATIASNCGVPSTTIDSPAPTAPPAIVTPPWTVCHSGPEPNTVPIVPNCSDFPGTKSPQPTPTQV